MKKIERVENRGEAKGMPLTVKGRRVSKDYLIENGIIEDWGAAPAKKDYVDTVSRQAAIDAIDKYNVFGYVEESFKTLEKALLELPAARPEIIRCKDCKYMTEHYYTDGNAPYWTCSEWDSGTDYDGFCHYAERRTDG